MKPKVLLIVFSVVAAATSIAMLVAPGFYLFVYGASADAQALPLLRYVGALFGGLAVMAWLGRMAEATQSRAMVIGLAVLSGLGAIASASMALTGNYNVVVWISVAIQTVFCAGFVLVAKK
jgi:hypothetical protein